MPSSSDYRQNASFFRSRLNTIAARTRVGKSRIHIDSGGNHTRRQPSRSMEEKLRNYGERRYHSVARILALFEIVRKTERLSAPGDSSNPAAANRAMAWSEGSTSLSRTTWKAS